MELAGESAQYVYKTSISVLIKRNPLKLRSNQIMTEFYITRHTVRIFSGHSTSLARQENVARNSRLSCLTDEAVPVRVYITPHLPVHVILWDATHLAISGTHNENLEY